VVQAARFSTSGCSPELNVILAERRRLGLLGPSLACCSSCRATTINTRREWSGSCDNSRIEPDPESWEYQKSYAVAAALKRWGVPAPVTALLKMVILPPLILVAVIRVVRREEIDRSDRAHGQSERAWDTPNADPGGVPRTGSPTSAKPDRLPLLLPYWFKLLALFAVALAVMFERWWIALVASLAVVGEVLVRRNRRRHRA
jgi:hypothetical protein